MKNVLFSSLVAISLLLMVASSTSLATDTAGKHEATTKVKKMVNAEEANATSGLGVGKCGTGMQGKCGTGKCGDKLKAKGMKCGTGKCGSSKNATGR